MRYRLRPRHLDAPHGHAEVQRLQGSPGDAGPTRSRGADLDGIGTTKDGVCGAGGGGGGGSGGGDSGGGSSSSSRDIAIEMSG